MKKILIRQLCFHHIKEIRGQLTANQFVMGGKKVGHTERVCAQSLHNQQHNTNS